MSAWLPFCSGLHPSLSNITCDAQFSSSTVTRSALWPPPRRKTPPIPGEAGESGRQSNCPKQLHDSELQWGCEPGQRLRGALLCFGNSVELLMLPHQPHHPHNTTWVLLEFCSSDQLKQDVFPLEWGIITNISGELTSSLPPHSWTALWIIWTVWSSDGSRFLPCWTLSPRSQISAATFGGDGQVMVN